MTTEIYTTNILNKDTFWNEGLRQLGEDFIFSCHIAIHSSWRGWEAVDTYPKWRTLEERRKGVVDGHAYAVLDTYEGYGQRLVKIRNPWGKTEWTGAWSDGSKEWTAEWFQRLNHKFGDDGVFWMSYEDMLKKYKYMDRTRIFGPEWHIAQRWTSVQVPWRTSDYQQTKFTIDVPEDTDAVIVLSQLDNRYFRGLEGPFDYTLQFRVQSDDEEEDEYLARSRVNYELDRSTNVEVFLEKGKYTVLFKVEATKAPWREEIEKVIRENIHRKEKITQVATLYDLAFAKGKPAKTEKKDEKKAERNEEKKEVEDKDNEAKKEDEIKTEEPEQEKADGDGEKKDNDKEDKQQKDESTQTQQEEQPSPPPVLIPDDDDSHRDPWNAFCVVGLRVYSKQPDLQLKVVLPSEERPAVLDRDDIAKAALEEAEAAIAEKGESTESKSNRAGE